MSLFLLAGLGAVLSISSAHAQEVSYALRPTWLAPAERAPVRSDTRRVPRGVSLAPPLEDGGLFAAVVEPGTYPVSSTRDVTRALTEILPALGVNIDVGALVLVSEGEPLPMVDLGALVAEGELLSDSWVEATERRVGPLSAETLEVLVEEGRAAYARAATPIQLWRYRQQIGGARAEGRTLLVEVDDTGIRRVSGALYGDTSTVNRVTLDAARAISYAERYASAARGRSSGSPELVALEDGTTLRYAWRVTMETTHGQYLLDIDAAGGSVLQVDPQFDSIASGFATVAIPGAPLTFDMFGLAVNSASGCNYTLDHGGVLTMTNGGADGYPDDVKVCLNAAGEAAFNVNPINETFNILNATAPNYNWRFAQVNAYTWAYTTLDYFESRGSGSLPPWEITVNDDDACGWGINNACATTGSASFGAGSATVKPGGAGLFNTALDATVVAHELGHGLNNLRYAAGGGVQNKSVGEGLGDYWAMSLLNQDIIGVVAMNTTIDVETGGIPRRADAADVFPEHLVTMNEFHANGQVLARALWASRVEMNGRSPLGPIRNDQYLMAALPAAGAGQSGYQSHKAVHESFRGILLSMLAQSDSGYDAGDILVGFAQAGLFVTEREVAIDISDDILAFDDPTPPTFQVWTGRDFGFTDSYTNADTSYGNRYQVEVANDMAFTENLVSSGIQSNVGITDGVATATWQLSEEDWEVLSGGNALYFRVIAWDAEDPWHTARTSTHYNAELVEIGPALAIINHGEEASGCSAVPQDSTLSGGLMIAMVALLRRRRSAAATR
ncbi:MAG: MYXO-CTERM sorting domain-containing protein [Myxococcota bacterium]